MRLSRLRVQIARNGEEDLEWSATMDANVSFLGLKTPKVEMMGTTIPTPFSWKRYTLFPRPWARCTPCSGK